MANNKKKKSAKKKASSDVSQSQSTAPTTVPTTTTTSLENSNAVKGTVKAAPPRSVTLQASSTSTATATTSTSAAANFKREGNAAYAAKKYLQAAAAYRAGLAACHTDTTTDTTRNTRVHLHSNLAMVLLKLQDYAAAELECTKVLDDLQETSLPKVWYRRAVARDARANALSTATSTTSTSSSSTTAATSKQLWQAAKSDLARALQLLDTAGGAADAATKRSVVQMAVTVQRSCRSLQKREQHRLRTAKTSDRPTAAQQKQDVWRLLVARQGTLQKQQEGSRTLSAAVALPGEAFFLVDWDWWCDWCTFVGFAAADQGSTGTGAAKEPTLVSYLPPGAVLPTVTEPDDDDDDDDEDDYGGPPGVIDNRNLFLVPPQPSHGKLTTTRDAFCQQWYQAYLARTATLAAAATTTTTLPAEEDLHAHYPLQPNLVRGYHYELLPREVYNALVLWYGEALPSVCRRTAQLMNESNGNVNSANTANGYNHHNQVVCLPLYSLASLPERQQQAQAAPVNSSYCDACRAPHARLRCKRCMSVYYCDRSCQESHWTYHKGDCQVLVDQKGTANSSLQTSIERPILSNGRVGLNNIGNTCFMNSALQCLSHATPLTRLFLSNKFRTDLNTSNPLGTGGKLAHAYEIMVKDLWMRLSQGSTSPTALKRAIALFAPRFAGYLQHDAQEFLAYLLDGLHEDLNRIRNAPYVEMPDVTDGQNMGVASARAWEAHQRRNNSLVMDTFYGQFKSTCVCPGCKRVSVSFDAFNHVSLEIPQVKNAIVTLSALVYRAVTPESPARKAVQYGLQIRQSETVGDVKQALSSLSGVDPKRLVLCDVYQSAIFEMLSNEQKPISEVRASTILAYEVDPFDTEDCYHVVASHRLFDASVDPAEEGEEKVEQIKSEPFGMPFMTSFSAELTCRQAWEYLWSHVDRLVGSETSAEEDSIASAGQSLLQIHLTDGRGSPLLAFPVPSTDSPDGDEPTAVPVQTSILPKESDEKLVTFLGPESTGTFVFIHFVWKSGEAGNPQEDGEAKTQLLIDEDCFIAVDKDPSWDEAMKKLRATKSAKGVSLDQCFETFTKPERLDENNQWYCSSCKEHVRAMKTMELWRLPNILVVHLKRFEFKHALRRDKLDSLVDFPLEGLDMSLHCAASSVSSFVNESVPAIYDLFAVTNHFGRMGFGHYTAYARRWDESSISDDWALFDDSSVRSVGNGMEQGQSVVSPAAYVLFYRRRTFH